VALIQYNKRVMGKSYDSTNFFESTIVNWDICKQPKTNPDWWSFSGSSYWYTDKGVIRLSDHWGTVGTCLWTLDWMCSRKYLCGFCKWEDFQKFNS
jgi:hypothetical protein